uniref:Dynamin-type G domain-containing protein n=1 Tax=Cyprinus carpio TaxID=7962 RepID=A0A8C2HNX4_CYPCA
MRYFFSSSSSSSSARSSVQDNVEDTDNSLKERLFPIFDQSSGKSSVLEALSGIALPRGSGIVTRCPLELRLRNVTGGVSWKAVLSYHKKKIEKTAEAGYVCFTAQNELAGKGVKICDDLITLEVRSADVCDLTLIDLPGIARVPVQGQPQDTGNQIKRLIMKFIEKPETINMVVVPCNTDIAKTEALKMAQEVDPEGVRTFAILTKPDLIDRGTEKNILAVVQNKVIPLRKGYVMVKCRGQQQIDEKVSLVEATQIERDFFQNHDFFSQQVKTEQRIMDQFEMECMIYTQDPIYLKFLNEISGEKFSEAQLPVFDIKSKYSEMLQAYYEIVVQRMADQLPMLISFYMLKETAQLLCTDMLSILEGANVSELLFEDSDLSKRRKTLHCIFLITFFIY